MHIGILEDDRAQQEIYRACFATVPHDCACYETVAAFLDALKSNRFDLLLIDWMLPDGTGEQVLTWVRENLGWDLPIIFVTARDAEADIVNALRKGADDYVVKPPKYQELLARIETLGRRSKVSIPKALRLGSYEINQDLRTIYVSGKLVDLTQKEFELAAYLFQNPGKLLSRIRLLEQIWGLNADVDTRTVDTHISRIRRKLGISPKHGWQIIPVYGYGYRIERVEPGSSQVG